MMQLKFLMHRAHTLETNDLVILLSYQDPVAYYDKLTKERFKSSDALTITTKKHIRTWANGEKCQEIEQSELNKLLDYDPA